MTKYDHSSIEKKWQEAWELTGVYKNYSKSESSYVLDMFPYPSGAGLHVGHPKGYIATDVVARMKMLQGKSVLHPMGWDAFGLPAENYAIKNKVHPAISVAQNIVVFKQQLKKIGFTYDWDCEVNTTDPQYYRWTQWIFLKLFEHGLAYEADEPINWCPSCKTGLANEDLDDGKCERCGSVVEQKKLRQWKLRMTAYADRLLEDLDKEKLNWEESIKIQQRNWIGRSEGLEETWQVEGMVLKLATFTTWPHTTWGATFMVVAPEHPLIAKLVEGTEYSAGAQKFIKEVLADKIKDPRNIEKIKKGYFLGRSVLNHLNGRKMPLYIANFAIYNYGTGIVKCTPAHDQRDFEFAKLYKLDIVPVIVPENGEALDPVTMTEAYTGEGTMVNAGKFDGLPTMEARKVIGDFTVEKGGGQWTVNYKMRDWVFSRQRYWGEPIPVVHCEQCGVVPVAEKDLPVVLPDVERYEPTGTGESPLAAIQEWVNISCPKCSGAAKRETNTMPQWAGSSWYYLRYLDPRNETALVDLKLEKKWMPVDLYVGGAEHATRHLLYARFWHKFLFDIGVVTTVEPFKRLVNVGLILAEDGRKMSKRWNNVINPDDVIAEFGADSLRLYEMFMGPFTQSIAWSTDGLRGMRRFLDRVWNLVIRHCEGGHADRGNLTGGSPARNASHSEAGGPRPKGLAMTNDVDRLLHQTIKKVTDDIDNFRFNTAISQLMILVNEMERADSLTLLQFHTLLLLLSPFAPHMTEELWHQLGNKESIFTAQWPVYNAALAKEETVEFVVQINGKVRDRFTLPVGLSQEETEKIAFEREAVKKWVKGKELKKKVFVQDTILNIVIA